MAELLEDLAVCQAETEERIANVRQGALPAGVEDALLPVVSCTDILWAMINESAPYRLPTAEQRRCQAGIDYLAEQLRAHVAALRRAIDGDDNGDDGEEIAAYHDRARLPAWARSARLDDRASSRGAAVVLDRPQGPV